MCKYLICFLTHAFTFASTSFAFLFFVFWHSVFSGQMWSPYVFSHRQIKKAYFSTKMSVVELHNACNICWSVEYSTIDAIHIYQVNSPSFIIFWHCLFCCQQQGHFRSYFAINQTQLIELVMWQGWYAWISILVTWTKTLTKM